MYAIPDLTGQNDLYRVTNHVTVIHKAKQKFHFRGTIFADSIQLIKLGTVNTPLLKDRDWVINPEDIDEETTGDILLKDQHFDKVLVKSITVVAPFIGAYRASAIYQRLYPVMGKIALFNDEPIEETPDLIAYLLRQSNYYDLITSPVTDVQGNPVLVKNPLGLEPDPHLQRPENIIRNEIHEMDVPGGHKFIHPLGGSYFAGTLVVRNMNTGDTMKRGIDYEHFHPNLYKSELSSHKPSEADYDKPGVYEFVVLLKAFTGQISIDYHAFGGEVTLYDQRALLETVNNIIQFITQNQFVTYNNLRDAPLIAGLWSKYNDLENKMRILLAGKPTYADSTHGDAMKLRITANDTNLHWYNIAELYKVDAVGGNNEVVLADTMKLRIKSQLTGFMFDAVVAYNKLAPNSKMDVKILSEIYPQGYIPYVDYSGLNSIIRPQFRIIWNVNEAEDSGAMLQLGFQLKGVAEEIFGIEDWSGTQSCWKLHKPDDPDIAQGPNDNIVTLPSNNHIWDMDNPDSRFESILMPFESHLIFAGALPLNTASKTMTYNNINHILESNIDITKIKKFFLDLSEDGSNRYTVEGPCVQPGSNNIYCSMPFFYNSKPAYFNLRCNRLSDNSIRIDIESYNEYGISANPLLLSHVRCSTKA